MVRTRQTVGTSDSRPDGRPDGGDGVMRGCDAWVGEWEGGEQGYDV